MTIEKLYHQLVQGYTICNYHICKPIENELQKYYTHPINLVYFDNPYSDILVQTEFAEFTLIRFFKILKLKDDEIERLLTKWLLQLI